MGLFRYSSRTSIPPLVKITQEAALIEKADLGMFCQVGRERDETFLYVARGEVNGVQSIGKVSKG